MEIVTAGLKEYLEAIEALLRHLGGPEQQPPLVAPLVADALLQRERWLSSLTTN